MAQAAQPPDSPELRGSGRRDWGALPSSRWPVIVSWVAFLMHRPTLAVAASRRPAPLQSRHPPEAIFPVSAPPARRARRGAAGPPELDGDERDGTLPDEGGRVVWPLCRPLRHVLWRRLSSRGGQIGCPCHAVARYEFRITFDFRQRDLHCSMSRQKEAVFAMVDHASTCCRLARFCPDRICDEDYIIGRGGVSGVDGRSLSKRDHREKQQR